MWISRIPGTFKEKFTHTREEGGVSLTGDPSIVKSVGQEEW